MIQPEWGCIAGMQVQEDGDIALVYMAHDKKTDTLHLYDAFVFETEVLAVIAQGINGRGRWIPVSWTNKDMADKLLKDYGCNMLPEATNAKPEFIEVISRDIQERMRTGRFKVETRLKNWQEEFKAFTRKDSEIPIKAFPLMAATNHAVAELDYARKQNVGRRAAPAYPRVSVV